MGAVLAAVSPAVVVPRMVKLLDEGYGVKEGIPQLILAGASVDDVFVIVIFTSLTALASTGEISLKAFTQIPVSDDSKHFIPFSYKFPNNPTIYCIFFIIHTYLLPTQI